MALDPMEARNKGGDYFRVGYNCAESIFLAFRDLLDTGVPREMVRAFTGLGGGLGHAGCLCGALTGSALVLGLLKGRTDVGESRDPAYDLTREFHDRFESHYGYTCCRSLNPHPFDSKDHLRNCIKITGNTSKMLAEFMNEKKLAG